MKTHKFKVGDLLFDTRFPDNNDLRYLVIQTLITGHYVWSYPDVPEKEFHSSWSSDPYFKNKQKF